MRIITHQHVDVDAVASVWATRKFVPEYANAPVVFVPGNWDGAEAQEGDFIVDIKAGGKGLKGVEDAQNRVHSCVATILDMYATKEDREALKYMIEHIDIEDSRGTAVDTILQGTSKEVRRVVGAFSARNLINDLRAAFGPGSDQAICDTMHTIFTGAYKEGYKRLRTERAAQDPEYVTLLPSKQIAIVKNTPQVGGLHTHLFQEEGIQAAIIIDGHNLLLRRKDDTNHPMNHPKLLAYLKEIGEQHEWFAHPSGFMLARGTKTSPATTMSKADPMKLATILDEIVT